MLRKKKRFSDSSYFSRSHQTSGDNGKHWQVKACQDFPRSVSCGDDKSRPQNCLPYNTQSKILEAVEIQIHHNPQVLQVVHSLQY